MASKRDLKKSIGVSCGKAAGVCFRNQAAGHGDDPQKWNELVIDLTLLQDSAVRKLSAPFGKRVKDFGTRHDYRKARHAFAVQSVSGVIDYVSQGLAGAAERINALDKQQ